MRADQKVRAFLHLIDAGRRRCLHDGVVHHQGAGTSGFLRHRRDQHVPLQPDAAFRCLLIIERLATLNGIVYDDDEQIAKSYASKRYSELPGATVTVRAL